MRATRAIAERCAFTLADLGYAVPAPSRVPAGETEQSYLEQLTWRGAAEPLPTGSHRQGVRRQLERELTSSAACSWPAIS